MGRADVARAVDLELAHAQEPVVAGNRARRVFGADEPAAVAFLEERLRREAARGDAPQILLGKLEDRRLHLAGVVVEAIREPGPSRDVAFALELHVARGERALVIDEILDAIRTDRGTPLAQDDATRGDHGLVLLAFDAHGFDELRRLALRPGRRDLETLVELEAQSRILRVDAGGDQCARRRDDECLSACQLDGAARLGARMNSEGYTQNLATPHRMDDRFRALEAWLRTALAGASFRLEPASADASFRRYFRVFLDRGTFIAMDAPPDRENSAPFVHVAQLLRRAGLNAPEVHQHDLAKGFLLVTDLGTTPYLAALDEGNAQRLLGDATDALVRWQCASCEGELPVYDEPLLAREVALFPDWYVARHLGVALDATQREAFEGVVQRVVRRNLAEPRGFVHRDYMPRNLMVTDPNPGILDFQDAVYGPVSYDIACLYRDAFISWDEERVLDGTIRYWEGARAAGLPVRADFADFWQDVEWMGVQRHLKVLGIFARLSYRDGKPGYLADTPRFIGYVRQTASRYRDLAPLRALLDELEGAHPEMRCTS